MSSTTPEDQAALTPRALSIYRAIEDFIAEHHYAPSNRELAELVGLKSVATVNAYLQDLRDRGLITWQPGIPRTIQIIR